MYVKALGEIEENGEVGDLVERQIWITAML